MLKTAQNAVETDEREKLNFFIIDARVNKDRTCCQRKNINKNKIWSSKKKDLKLEKLHKFWNKVDN